MAFNVFNELLGQFLPFSCALHSHIPPFVSLNSKILRGIVSKRRNRLVRDRKAPASLCRARASSSETRKSTAMPAELCWCRRSAACRWTACALSSRHACQSASKGDPGSACKKNPRRASFCSVQRCHPSAPAHAVAEPARGTAVKNGRFIGGRPQGLFLRAVSTAA